MSQFQRGPLALAFLALLLATGCGSTVIPVSSGTTVSSQSPSFVYLATSPHVPGGNASLPSSTLGYSIAANGQLTPIPGFPLPYPLSGLISGNYLFTGPRNPSFSGGAADAQLDTYRIGADGSLTQVQTSLDPPAAQCQCEVSPALTDRTGASLYVEMTDSSNNLFYQTFSIDQNTGALTFLSTDFTARGPGSGFDLQTFSANDQYGYGTECSINVCNIASVTRKSDGSLSSNLTNVATGPAPPPGILYGWTSPQANTQNDLVAEVYSMDASSENDLPNLPDQLVVYNVNANGSLTTANTTADMVSATNVGLLSLSPSGELLAVTERDGIQIFQLNGGSPPTPVGALLPTDPIEQIQWDNSGHLFALSLTMKLYVFDVDGTTATPAPGSPTSVPNATGMTL